MNLYFSIPRSFELPGKITHAFKEHEEFIIVDDSTIREARDRQEETRPRKRQRVDEDEEEDRKKEEAGSAGARLVCDPNYYKEDGDCVVRVDNILFKVNILDDVMYVISNYELNVVGP